MKLFQPYYLLITFLSLTATANAQLAKKGCEDTCGSVKIPYPFGIGEKCSINEWYVVDCNSSTPYLRAVNNVEVLRVDLDNLTITVSTPRMISSSSGCLNPVPSFDLGTSPFLFSNSRDNKLVFEGCGNAVMMMGNGSVVTGCSTTCLNDTVLSDRNKCFGISCCESTSIPHYLKSYSIKLTGFEKGIRENGSCSGSAFLVDTAAYSYDQGSVVIPVSLLWTLPDSNQVTCCYDETPTRTKVELFDGTLVDTYTCYTSVLEYNPYLIDGCKNVNPATPPTFAKHAKRGCKDKCGNVTIPYPFGIGEKCSVNHWYIIDCNSSTPYLPSLNHLEVLNVSLANLTVTVSTPRITTDCQNPARNSTEMMGVDLGRSPFMFSQLENKFVLEGCGHAVMMDNESVVTGCSTTCPNDTLSDRNNCFGIGCCETAIPKPLKSYNIKLSDFETQGKNGICGSAYLVDKDYSYDPGRKNPVVTPVSLLWTLKDSDQVTCCYSSPIRRKLELFNGTVVDTWICAYYNDPSLEGNPYLIDGCETNIYDTETEECKKCRIDGGYCRHETTNYLFGGVYSDTTICVKGKSSKISLGAILGVSISMGVCFLIAMSIALYKFIKKTKEKRRRKMFFKRNGGILLKQQQEADSSLVDKTIIFTSRELEKATDNFNENRILGRGGQGTVYKGMLVDGRIVAVKKSKIVDESQLEQFINEVVILSQVNHRNVVKLLGCCLETDVPLLVSEFIPNGTLYDLLHNGTQEFPFSLDMRFQIATEIARALAYLHSATSIPIYHRDVKTTNVLLDEKYRAKVSDFGTSRFVAEDQTHLTTLVKGTFGYLDPEYFQSSQFTEKSDVYSFGVVLVELLTGERPISLTRFGENRSLATHFMLAMEEERVMSVFDARVIQEGSRDVLLMVANLAMRCLNFNGKYRPTMKEVAVELETIRTTHIPSTVQTNIMPMICGEELSVQTYGESSSTYMSLTDSFS